MNEIEKTMTLAEALRAADSAAETGLTGMFPQAAMRLAHELRTQRHLDYPAVASGYTCNGSPRGCGGDRFGGCVYCERKAANAG